MANPQLEDGYTKIANDIVDALCRSHPGGSEGQVLLAIIRKTYGWNKACDKISISQLCDMTGLARRTVIYAMQNLESKNMIDIARHRSDSANDVNLISFQKDYSRWVVQEIDGSARKSKSYKATIEKQKNNYKLKVVQEIDGSARKRQGVVQENNNNEPFLAPTKDTITKDNITKEKGKKNKTSISPDFKISDRVRKWASEKKQGSLDEHLESFIAKCIAHDYRYVDWDAAFMEAIRGNWARIDTKTTAEKKEPWEV